MLLPLTGSIARWRSSSRVAYRRCRGQYWYVEARISASWEGRERIPEWMPWIASVDVDPADPRLSRWVLRREAFGRDFEFSWTSRNLAVMPAQSYSKIQWRSVEGSAAGVGVPGLNVKNRGEVMLYPRGPDRCQVKLKIEYEVPDALLPMATALDGLVGEILDTDMKGFARFAEEEYQKRQGA